MTTLATPRHAVIFRCVAGAVKNAADGHPKWKLSRAFTKMLAHSVAKRATGTLAALDWPQALAAQQRSEQAGEFGPPNSPPADGPRFKQSGRRPWRGAASTRARQQRLGRSPLKFLHNRIGYLAGCARRAGETEREEAYTTVLRLIAAQMQKVTTNEQLRNAPHRQPNRAGAGGRAHAPDLPARAAGN